jgi:UDP-N-acetylmuramoyl-tripeptide--D-alanyl-D-alanine ligase
MNKAIFLDRDGTINVDMDYLHECDKLRFIEGSVEALKLFKEKGYLLIVVTNQSGVGRGYFPIEDVDAVNNHMNELLEEYNIRIDAFYCCPHIERDNCVCRKPKTYMYEKAAREFNVDISASYMVGDKYTDILPAIRLGCGYGLVLSGHDIDRRVLEEQKEHIYKNLLEFANSI